MKRKILLVCVSVFFALLILEVIFRFFNYPKNLAEQYKRRDLSWLEKHVVINSMGYRDGEFSQDRKVDTFRIYAVGDSYTFGWLIDNPKNSYPKLLETELEKKLGKKVEVINAGTPGFSIYEDAQRFLSQGVQFHPDLVSLEVNDDEALVSHAYFLPKDEFLPQFIKNLRIYKASLGTFFRNISEKENHDYLRNIYIDKNSKDWNDFSQQILLIQKEAAKYNAALAIVVSPHIHPSQPNAKYDLFPYNEKLKQFGREHNIIIIDPLEEFLKYENKEKLVINPVDAHPTAEMNKLIVDAYMRQFDAEDYIAHHKPYVPKIRTVSITDKALNVGNYIFIRNISQSSNNMEQLPWVYFETKNGDNIQEFPLADVSFRQTKFYTDRIQVVSSKSGIIGADILYYTYPKKQGQIVLPEKIYGYPAIGFNNLYGIYVVDGANRGKFIEPTSVVKKHGNYIIEYNSVNDYHLFKLNIKVGVKKLDIGQSGEVKSLTQVIQLQDTQREDSNTVSISLPKQPLLGFPEFFDGAKRSLYAFVDQTLTNISNIEQKKDFVTLKFNNIIKNGQKVSIFSAVDYKLEDGENINVEVEY